MRERVLDLKIVHKDSTSLVSALVQMYPGSSAALLIYHPCADPEEGGGAMGSGPPEKPQIYKVS